MHLGYSTPIHARQALARNGVIIDGNTRVGVNATPEKVCLALKTFCLFFI